MVLDGELFLSKDPRIMLDVLKASAADAMTRKVGTQDRHDRPWKALASALRHALTERLRDSGEADDNSRLRPENITEIEVRRRLIEIYLQPLNELEAVIRAKLNDELSFFHLAGYQSVEEVQKHWTWYLQCLTLEDSCFEPFVPLFLNEEVLDDYVYCRDIQAEHQQDFASAFQISLMICVKDANLQGLHTWPPHPAIIFEATHGNKSVLQLALGDGDLCGRVVARVLTKSGHGPRGEKECRLTPFNDIISEGGDLLREVMTVEEAKSKVASLTGCKGFCFKFESDNEQGQVEVFFQGQV